MVNAAWRERFEGRNQPTEGAGAVTETNVLHGLFQQNSDDFHRRVLLVVLPGASEDDVPLQLRGVQRFTVTEFTRKGLDKLVRHLTRQPLYVPPPVGPVPVLPPAVLESNGATAQAAAEIFATGPLGVDAPLEAELRDHDAVLSAVQRTIADQPGLQEALAASAQAAQLPSLTEAIGRALSSSSAFQDLQRATAAAAQTMLSSSRASSAASVGLARMAPRLAGLLEQVSEAVEAEDRCWLLLAGALGDPDAAAEEERDGRSVRQRRREQVSSWIARMHPPVPLDQEPDATRTTGRVVLSADAAAPSAALSAWRLELGDHGEAVAAVNVAGAVVTGSPFDPPEDGSRQYPELHLPVRMDLLELWLLTQVQLMADHLAPMVAGRGDASVFFQARLLLPDRLTHPEAHPRRHGVRLVAEHRDEDGHRSGDSAVPGATDLRIGSAPPEVGPLRTTVEALADPTRLIRTTRSMAVELLEHFGVEDTSVLRPDGTLDELAAAGADQQAVWVHAGALGAMKDPVSPAQRRDRYEELLAQARAALRR